MASMNPDPRNHAPTAQDGQQGAGQSQEMQDWMSRARSAFYASSAYMDSNYRKVWEDSIRAFYNQHPTDSKFVHPAYEKRSRVYRPKTRAIIRKTEAAGAAAFFSNMDVVSVEATDESNKAEQASAEVMKELLQYRLSKSVPWYQVVLGGLQDAQVTAACAHVYWEYKEEPEELQVDVEAQVRAASPQDALAAVLDKTQHVLGLTAQALGGEATAQKQAFEEASAAEEAPPSEDEYPDQGALPPGALRATAEGTLSSEPSESIEIAVGPRPVKVISDKPVVDLFPVENLRIDPGANWLDPVNSSPYLIHLMPMYVLDIKARMQEGVWYSHGDNVIAAATESKPDSTRLARNKDRDDPYGSDARSIGDYEMVWVQRHIHRRDGQDWEFYTLGDRVMLTEPAPLKDSVLHGKRPYVIGTTTLETHKLFPSTVPQLSRGLQDEINEVANQRLDNVKFVLNKKFLVKRGKEADIGGLVRNVPGGVVMLDDPTTDVKELTWQDVTASSFQEHQGLNMDMDELLGNFNPAQLMTMGAGNAPARNMALLNGAQGSLVEYSLRTYVETFVQPVLRHLVQLEQSYETDRVVLKLAAQKAQIFQKYGIDDVTDDLLKQELTLTVNVGMGATDPMQKLNKFLTAMTAYSNLLKTPVPGLDMKEVGKEIFGHLGYQNGKRFFGQQDPQVLALQQQLQQMQGVIAELQKKVGDKQQANQIAAQKVIVQRDTALQTVAMREHGANQRALATHWRALHENNLDHAQAVHLKTTPAPVLPRPPVAPGGIQR